MSDHKEVPEHVQFVRNMSVEVLQHEAESIYSLPAIEPERILPDSFKDNWKKTDRDPED